MSAEISALPTTSESVGADKVSGTDIEGQIKCQEPISGTLVEESHFRFLIPFRLPDTFSIPGRSLFGLGHGYDSSRRDANSARCRSSGTETRTTCRGHSSRG